MTSSAVADRSELRIAAADVPLPCPGCGYDLRATIADRCPECGAAIDDEIRAGEATIPWQHRRRLGGVRAFRQTLAWALFRPTQLARQAGRDVGYRDARRFQLVCCTLAWLGIGPPSMCGLWAAMRLGPQWAGAESTMWPATASGWVGDGSLVVAAGVGLFLWLLMGTGLPSYFFHPRWLAIPLQNRAVALSYYGSASVVLLPIASLATAAAWALAARWNGFRTVGRDLPLPVLALVALGITAVWLAVIVPLLALPLMMLRHGLHAGGGRMALCGLVLAIGWPILFALTVVGLPLLVLYVQLALIALQ